MSETANQLAAASCEYCGRKNPDRLPNCAGCGTPLVSAAPLSTDTKPKAKSKGVAVALAFIFGPLGLLYVRAWGPMLVIIAITVPFMVAGKGGLWLTLGVRIVCAAWAYSEVVEQGGSAKPRRDAARLLDKAALLESTDRSQAIALYEQIVRLYPDTPSGIQAARNIETLKRPVATAV